MKRLIAIIAVFLLSGCVGDDKPAPAQAPAGIEYPVILQGDCKHRTLHLMAIAISYGLENEAVLGWLRKPSGKLGYHAAVRVQYEGGWYWAYLDDLDMMGLSESFVGEFVVDDQKQPMRIREFLEKVETEWLYEDGA